MEERLDQLAQLLGAQGRVLKEQSQALEGISFRVGCLFWFLVVSLTLSVLGALAGLG